MNDPNETKIICPECDGARLQECEFCYGEGYDEDGDECDFCYGNGERECDLCNGDGEIYPSEFED